MTTSTTHQIADIATALREAHRDGLLDHARNDVLTGLSGTRLVGALQRLTSLLREDECYCEVGVFQGLTLLSTAYANPSIACFGIDNFSQFDAGSVNEALVRQRADALNARNARLVNADFEVALRTADQWLEGRRVGVYFVDGPHDYRSQLVCLLRAKRLLAPGAVIVVDDANYEHVRRANADFLESHDEFALLFEAYTPCHPANMNEAQRKLA